MRDSRRSSVCHSPGPAAAVTWLASPSWQISSSVCSARRRVRGRTAGRRRAGTARGAVVDPQLLEQPFADHQRAARCYGAEFTLLWLNPM